GREVERRPELGFRLVVAAEPEVGDPERLADGRLVRLLPLRLFERHGGLRGLAPPEPPPPFLEVVVDLAHVPLRYPKFSATKSNGSARSRVGPMAIAPA